MITEQSALVGQYPRKHGVIHLSSNARRNHVNVGCIPGTYGMPSFASLMSPPPELARHAPPASCNTATPSSTEHLLTSLRRTTTNGPSVRHAPRFPPHRPIRALPRHTALSTTAHRLRRPAIYRSLSAWAELPLPNPGCTNQARARERRRGAHAASYWANAEMARDLRTPYGSSGQRLHVQHPP